MNCRHGENPLRRPRGLTRYSRVGLDCRGWEDQASIPVGPCKEGKGQGPEVVNRAGRRESVSCLLDSSRSHVLQRALNFSGHILRQWYSYRAALRYLSALGERSPPPLPL
ncbi:unnamed protein product [Timema podura]|uniref:Uncharacterized protein n=1 Tax=Timema podura TaxID=61482 RepID=A0ABN7P039_TIMPD|nr:unnamed protein product [Timema podura]